VPAALKIADFRFLFAGNLISGLGSWLLVVAVPYQVFRLTGSTAATGLTLAAESLPALLVGPVAGVFVDRWDRRRLMITADLLRAVAVAGILLADRPDRLVWLYLALVAENLGTVFFRPAAPARGCRRLWALGRSWSVPTRFWRSTTALWGWSGRRWVRCCCRCSACRGSCCWMWPVIWCPQC
jgi:MFS family permease